MAGERETALRWRSPILVPSEIVQGRHLVSNAIIARHISASAVTTAKIADEAVTAAKIANRTRNLFLSLGGATIRTGAPDLAMRGTNTQYRAWAFDAAAAETIAVEFVMPEDVASGNLTLKIYWTNLGAGAGDVVWTSGRPQNVADGGDLNDNSATPTNTTITAPAQNVLKISTLGLTATAVASGFSRLNITRAGADAADTLGNDAGLVAIEIEYTADS